MTSKDEENSTAPAGVVEGDGEANASIGAAPAPERRSPSAHALEQLVAQLVVQTQQELKAYALCKRISELLKVADEGGDGETSANIQRDLANSKKELLSLLIKWEANENSGPIPDKYFVLKHFLLSHQLAAILNLFKEVCGLVLPGLRVQRDESWDPFQLPQAIELKSLMEDYESAMSGKPLPGEYVCMKQLWEMNDIVWGELRVAKKTNMTMTSKLNDRGR